MGNLSKGKNFVQRNFDNVYSILSSLDHGYNTNAGLTEYLGIPKQNTNYWLGKLRKEGLIDKPKPGIYEITKSGKKVYRGFKQQLNKDCIRLENMRFKYPIYEGLENLLNSSELRKTFLNKTEIHHGKINGFTVRVFVGKDPSMEITAKQWHGYDIYQMMYDARNDIEIEISNIIKKYDLRLGPIENAMEPEWAISSPLAEEILNKTCSSQIRSEKWVINRSKGRKADLETRDIRLANKIFNMPANIDEIRNEITIIKQCLTEFQSQKPNYNFSNIYN